MIRLQEYLKNILLKYPYADFRWAFLYKNQKKDVFMDSHVRFFEMIGGVYKEIVYDNMRNVVSKFIGRNEKILNEDLIKMSIYYGFVINVTNCFSGNEKEHVEGSAKIIRNRIFTINYMFKSLENNFYLVPEYLVGRDVNVKSYHDKIMIYSNNIFVCEHKKLLRYSILILRFLYYSFTFYLNVWYIKSCMLFIHGPK